MITTRPEPAGTFGVVAGTHRLESQAGIAVPASQAGRAVPARDGITFDAACAAAFTTQVAEPDWNGSGRQPVGR